MGAQYTPGPWAWFGNQHGIYLATVNRGRRYVMGFDRMGMNNAQPTFQVAGRMRPASELVEFEVGDQTARGFKEGKADESVYRLDVSGIDAPDAHLIAAAPELLAAVQGLEPYLDAIVCYASTQGEHEPNRLAVAARAAISRALPGGEGK
jgi:hypothetical protein